MLKQNLAGIWELRDCETGNTLPGRLPGCNYLDLQAAGLMKDPFWGDNEEEAKKLAYRDYVYSRDFILEEGLADCDDVTLTISGLDTLAVIHLNGQLVAETENAYRTWHFPVKRLLKTESGKANKLSILFKNPFPYLEDKQKERPAMLSSAFGVTGTQQIRKPMYHFGWDWAPALPPCGIFGDIELEGCTTARLSDVQVAQEHTGGQVTLQIMAKATWMDAAAPPLTARAILTTPDGLINQSIAANVGPDGVACLEIAVEDPQLWWCNGLGEQPLYQLDVQLLQTQGAKKSATSPLDSWVRHIGLRTIELNTEADQWGNNFQFRVNGAPIFAKGADWVPPDSFITRTTGAQLEFLIRSARNANMNMLRVWGGGFYESNAFYELCDQYGILVWQDIAFACASYPLNNRAYLDLVQDEVRDNVRRLRHHASLALWCGNNEVKAISDMSFKRPKELKQAEETFFFDTLQKWVAGWDNQTPYWPGSPTNGVLGGGKANSCKQGDTHLWQVWHGMQPLDAFHKFPTRFCSEYGTESLPSQKTLLRFTDNPEIDLFDPIMLQHQKSPDGNEKMLFYILSRYRQPATTRDYIYLSQLIQAETIRLATEEWRRKMGRCNGSLYWQYNDCWPTASWAGIEYEGEYKALQYKARHFNSMLCASATLNKSSAGLYVTNDYPASKNVCLRWALRGFDGEAVASGEESATLSPYTAKKMTQLNYRALLKGRSPSDVVLALEVLDGENTVNRQSILLVPDKDATLQKSAYTTNVTVQNGMASLTISTDSFARHAHIVAEAAIGPLSDNFFDIEKGAPVTITFPVAQNATAQSVQSGLLVRSLADVEAKGTPEEDRKLHRAIFMKKKNLLFYVLYRLLI